MANEFPVIRDLALLAEVSMLPAGAGLGYRCSILRMGGGGGGGGGEEGDGKE